ncbi:hypothetical protein QUF86_27410 [Peribacillus sp. NJ11]|uniref:hypothetical protein n=1 Tax=Peribacillus sp. NJ11 TaxID=3055861 RepID=UPI0025A12DBC|nr:hypothetical protein [Peribacillus sp. NJ11]MDM5224388.1 hypothetical protein [Peribacillus sp. NJ11]
MIELIAVLVIKSPVLNELKGALLHYQELISSSFSYGTKGASYFNKVHTIREDYV